MFINWGKNSMSDLNLPNKIELYVGRKIDFRKEVFLQDDGQGAYIKEWLIADKEKPTVEDLTKFETQAQQAFELNAVYANRVLEYPSIGDQLDALWKGGDEAAEMLAKVQAVKTKVVLQEKLAYFGVGYESDANRARLEELLAITLQDLRDEGQPIDLS
jgi:hypothetical protein